MQIIIGGHSDIGASRPTNQDSLFIKLADYDKSQICIGVVCDGVGGLQDGELASVVSTLFIRSWFDRMLREPCKDTEHLQQGLLDYMYRVNQEITLYSRKHNISTGTTVSVIIILGKRFFIVHIGDSRIYKVDSGVYQLTVDHTTTQLRNRDGVMVPKKLLTQCVGYRDELSIFCSDGWVKKDEVYLLCSDGFYDKMQESEIIAKVKKINAKTNIDAVAQGLISHIIKCKENDNVSLGIIKLI